LSDRQGAPHAKDWTLRLLAVAAADADHLAEAATLIGYTDANLRDHRILNSNHKWISGVLGTLLPQTDDRAAHERAGAAASRRDVFALIERLEHDLSSN
jgi:hypothetical protein